MPLMTYQLDFKGGPEDGLRRQSFHVPDTRLAFPAGYFPDGPTTVVYSRVADTTAAIYQYERTTISGQPTYFVPVLHYRFAGYRTPARQSSRSVHSACAWRLFAKLGEFLETVARW